MDMGLGGFPEMVMDRDAWRAAVHGVAKSRTRLSDWTELTELIQRIFRKKIKRLYISEFSVNMQFEKLLIPSTISIGWCLLIPLKTHFSKSFQKCYLPFTCIKCYLKMMIKILNTQKNSVVSTFIFWIYLPLSALKYWITLASCKIKQPLQSSQSQISFRMASHFPQLHWTLDKMFLPVSGHLTAPSPLLLRNLPGLSVEMPSCPFLKSFVPKEQAMENHFSVPLRCQSFQSYLGSFVTLTLFLKHWGSFLDNTVIK